MGGASFTIHQGHAWPEDRRSLVAGIIAFLKSQNTHFAWYTGVIGISFSAFMLLGGKVAAESWMSTHLPLVISWPLNASLEGASMVALYAWFPALIAAIIGRPPYVPQHGSVVEAKDIK